MKYPRISWEKGWWRGEAQLTPALRGLNKLLRPPELRSLALSFIGGFTRRKSAAFPKFDMVWLNGSLLPLGIRGVISSFKWFLPAFPRVKGGGSVGTLCSRPPPLFKAAWWKWTVLDICLMVHIHGNRCAVVFFRNVSVSCKGIKIASGKRLFIFYSVYSRATTGLNIS